MNAGEDAGRRALGLMAATGVGVGAIVGGGVFVMAGTAYATAGPAAALAFALNGLIALLTAMSFAEIASTFPENGGVYSFAKKVLPLRAAFTVGWILWFAYIVAGVLYALGFASFAQLAVTSACEAMGVDVHGDLSTRNVALGLASVATLYYGLSLVRQGTGGGQGATVGKVVGFVVIILAGLVALARQPISLSVQRVTPFFEGGAGGLLMAMGFTFIALQGFDLIATVGGEVRDPRRNIPRAMFLSLGCALAIYLPLLLLVSMAGVGEGERITEVALREPQRVIPLAAERFMGPVGYWVVIVAALLSTLSALHANVLAASRVARSMATDRTLPDVIGELHATRRTPVGAVYATVLTLLVILFLVPDVAAAGAASSLIFLIAFTCAHVTTALVRIRGGSGAVADGAFRTPWFPAVPLLGGLACASLAVFQALAVPAAGGIVLIWLALGVLLYWSLFAKHAEIGDAATAAQDPMLMRLRGASPLVLVPIANPEHAPALVSVANALTVRRVGRALLLSIVPLAESRETHGDGLVPPELDSVQEAVGRALRLSYARGYRPEALITAAPDPMQEIRRIADSHGCAAVVLGLGDMSPPEAGPSVERLINGVDADVALVRLPRGFRVDDVKRVLVPVAGRGDQHGLRARLLGGILTAPGGHETRVTFVTVLPSTASASDQARARSEIRQLGDLKVPGRFEVEVLCADDAPAALLEAASAHDLMIVGLRSTAMGKKAFGPFPLRVAQQTPCATIFLGRRRRSALGLLDPLRDDVVASIRDALPAAGRG